MAFARVGKRGTNWPLLRALLVLILSSVLLHTFYGDSMMLYAGNWTVIVALLLGLVADGAKGVTRGVMALGLVPLLISSIITADGLRRLIIEQGTLMLPHA